MNYNDFAIKIKKCLLFLKYVEKYIIRKLKFFKSNREKFQLISLEQTNNIVHFLFDDDDITKLGIYFSLGYFRNNKSIFECDVLNILHGYFNDDLIDDFNWVESFCYTYYPLKRKFNELDKKDIDLVCYLDNLIDYYEL